MPKQSKQSAQYLSIPRGDGKESKYVVCRIIGSSNHYPLTISATDGNYGFAAEFSKKDIQAGKSKNFDDKDGKWQNIVFSGLFGTGKDDIQLSADVAKNGEKLTINVGRVVKEEDEEYTARLGALEVPQDDLEVDLMDWVAECASNALDAQRKARGLEKETSSEHDTIEKLQKQLDTLIQAKEEHETELITKFNMLLNEKKAKIRELTNNGPVPEAIIPDEPDSADEPDEQPPKRGKAVKTSSSQSQEPTRGKRGTSASKPKTEKGKAVAKKSAPAAKGKRKRTPTPEPEVLSEDEPMQDGSATEDEEDSVQGDDERDADVERAFGGRKDDEGDVTEDEEL